MGQFNDRIADQFEVAIYPVRISYPNREVNNMLVGHKRIAHSGLNGFTSILLILPLILWSCDPDAGISNPKDFDVVVTLYDEGTDFGSFQVFSMPDSVVQLGDGELSGEFDDLILTQVAANLEAYGYTREMDPEQVSPDVFILVSVTTEEWNAYRPYDWWPFWAWFPGGDYWAAWGPGWRIFYPFAAPFGYDYTTGTILIEMIDPENVDEENETIPAVWSGAINGLLDDSSESIQARIIKNIAQCFEQSPYLKVD